MDVPKFRPQLTARETQERKEAVPVNISLNYTELIDGLRDNWLKTVDDHFQFLHEYHVTMARQGNKRNRFAEHRDDLQDEIAAAVLENVKSDAAVSENNDCVSDFRQDMELYRRLFQRFLILDVRRTQTLLLLQKHASLQTLRMQFHRQWPDHQDVRRFFSEVESELDDSWAVFDNEKVGIVGAEVLMAGKLNSKSRSRSDDEDERDEVLANDEGVDELVEGEDLDEEVDDELDEEPAQELDDEVDKELDDKLHAELDEEFDEDLASDEDLDDELFHDEELATARSCVAVEARQLFEEVKKLQTLFSLKGTRLDTNLFLAGDSDEDFQGLLEEHKRLAEPHMFGTAGRSRRVCRKDRKDRKRKHIGCGNNNSRPDLQTDLAYSSGSDMTTPNQPREKRAHSNEDLLSPAKRRMRKTTQTTVPCQAVIGRRQSSAPSFLVSRPRRMSDAHVEDAFSITLCENPHAQPGLVREEDQDQLPSSSHVFPNFLPSEVASSTESSLTEEAEASQFHCEDPIQSETSFATSINSFGESPSVVTNSFATPINSFGENPSVVKISFATRANSFEMSPSVLTSTPLRAARKSMMGTTGDDSGYCC